MGKEVDNKFTWVIKNFCSQQSKKLYSDEFVADGCKWRLLAYPKGNSVECLSLYLVVSGSEYLPDGWKRLANFYLTVVNQIDQVLSPPKGTTHQFDETECDFGFTSMLPLSKLHDKDGGFLVNGELTVVAGVDVLQVTGKLDVTEGSQETTKPLSKMDETDGAESNNLLKEASSVQESMDVSGFQLLPSQVESVSCIFERHPDIASEFRPKNQHLRSAYMNVLLSLIETMCQSTQELSKDDLADAYAALTYLTDAGMNVDWLEEKLDDVSEKKENEAAGEIRVQEIEEELKELKQKCSNLEAQLEKEKADVSLIAKDSSSSLMGKEVDNTYTWVIKNFSSLQLQTDEFRSEQFVIGGCKWRLIAYPEVNNFDDYLYMQLYLDVSDCESLPFGWRRHAKFSLSIINRISEKVTQLQESQQWFDEKTPGWGFPPMLTLKEISKKGGGFVVNDEVMIVATVDVLEVIGAIDASDKSESIDVKGFQVLPSQVKSVNRLFETHPDIASKLSIKNQSLKTAYMNVLLSLTETLHQSPTEISKDDLSDAETTLECMTHVGFKLDWLEDRFDELFVEKEKEGGEIRIQKIEQEFKDVKQKCSELEVLLKKEKAEVLGARDPLNEVVKWDFILTACIGILVLFMTILL